MVMRALQARLLLLSLATAGARVVIPKPLETQARAKPKSAVRVGGDRGNAVVRVGSLRGNAFEAVGFLAGNPTAWGSGEEARC